MVASVSACTTPHYYLEIDHALYYLTGKEGAGIWHGEGAKFLGFTGPVFSEQLIAAFSGLGSDCYTRHVQLPKGRNHQPAWDITFSAPKSVSVLWSVLAAEDRHRIEGLVMGAAKRAIDYLDAKALLTRRGKAGKKVEHAQGVYALCPHGTSRSQDPQLHVHALAINMCVRQDGSTGGIRSKDLYQHKMAAGAIFRLELARLLSEELGLKIEADQWSFKVSGVPQSLCVEQSKRREVIEQLAKEEGWSSPRLLAQLAITTRTAKGLVSMAECTKEWLEAGERHSFGRNEAAQLLATAKETIGVTHLARRKEQGGSQLLEVAIDKAIASLSNRQSYFAERELLQQVASHLQASGLGASKVIEAVEVVLKEFQSRVSIPSSHYCYYATEKTLADERELIAIAEKNRTSDSHPISDKMLLKSRKVVEKRLSEATGSAAALTFDQDTALIHVTQDRGAIKLIQGYAGTGKTQMLEAANLAWKDSGYEVLGTALSGKAVVGLEAATGISSYTISKLLLSLLPGLTKTELQESLLANASPAYNGTYLEGYRSKSWMKDSLGWALKEVEQDFDLHKSTASIRLTKNSILVVDEAGMVPTHLLLRLLKACDQVGAKVVLIGDTLQLPPIEAGGPFASLCNRLGCQHLTTVVRQRKQWMRAATYALIQNEPRLALDLYAANDALRIAKSHKSALANLVADYGKLPAQDFNASLALTSTRVEASQINAGVQQRRLAARQLGGESALLANGQRVYEQDRIVLTRNDYQVGVRNGMLGTIIGIQQPLWRGEAVRLEVQLDTPVQQKQSSQKATTIVIDLAKYSAVQLGYAVTTHKAQGATVKASYVLLGASMLNKEMAFTQLTRASHSCIIYAAQAQLGNTLENLAGRLSQSTAKDLASDYKLDVNSKRGIEQRQNVLRDAFSRLAPGASKELLLPTAYLSEARFGNSQTQAMGQLIQEYSKLTKEGYATTIAVVTDAIEARRINNGVQNHRRASQHIGGDALAIRQGEHVHQGDRLLVTLSSGQGTATTRLGTAIRLGASYNAVTLPSGETAYTPRDPSITIDLDPKHPRQQAEDPRERITIESKDFNKIYLGYAVTADMAKDINVENSLVLLPSQGASQEKIPIQLTRSTGGVSLFGDRACYEPILDAGASKGSFLKSLDGSIYSVPPQEQSSLRPGSAKTSGRDLAVDQAIDGLSASDITKRHGLLKDAFSRLTGGKFKDLIPPTAYLSGIALSAAEPAMSAWRMLLEEYKKLQPADFEKSIAAVPHPYVVAVLNASIQDYRCETKQINPDRSIRPVPYASKSIYEGDRVLVTREGEHGASQMQLGTVIEVQPHAKEFFVNSKGKIESRPRSKAITIDLDSPNRAHDPGLPKERITIEQKDFAKVELGYAATAEQLKDVKVENAFVLLPGPQDSQADVATLLTRASKGVALFGERALHEQLLDGGKEKGSFLNSLPPAKQDMPHEKSATLEDLYQQFLNEQRIQREQDEQLQRTRDQSLQR